MIERGIIINKKRANQVHDFSGLQFGNGTPTDIDAFMEFRDQLFVFMEFKLLGARIPFGQNLSLERLCKIVGVLIPSFLLHCSHDAPADQDIDSGNSQVIRYFHGKHQKWIVPKEPITAHTMVDRLINRYVKNSSALTDRHEWVEERIAIILEGHTFPLGDGRWGQGITEKQARALAETVYDTMFSDE